MVTLEEVELLKEACKGKDGLLNIVARIPFVPRCCVSCGHYKNKFCDQFADTLPDDYEGPCDDWDFKDIPF